MLLTCPPCNSKYLVNSADLKPDGRTVRCAKCRFDWFQTPDLNKEEKELHIRQSTDGVVMIGAGDQESEAEDASQEYADKLLQRASLHFNQLSGVDAIRVPVGFRPMPEDGLPVIGSSPVNNNIYLTLMHSGVTLAPLVGALAALEITTGISNADLDPYRPSRFSIKA